MSNLLERVKQLKAELQEQEASIAALRTQKLDRLGVLCQRGVLPEVEAVEILTARVDEMAHDGAKRFRNSIGTFTRPRHGCRNVRASGSTIGTATISGMLGFRPSSSPGLGISELPSVLCLLLRDEILEAGRAMIRDACAEAQAAGRLLPDEATRHAEIARLDDEVDQLSADQKAVRAELDSIGRARQGQSGPCGPAVCQSDAGGDQSAS